MWIKESRAAGFHAGRKQQGSAESASGAGGGLGGLLSGVLGGGASGAAPSVSSLPDLNGEGDALDEIIERTAH